MGYEFGHVIGTRDFPDSNISSNILDEVKCNGSERNIGLCQNLGLHMTKCYKYTHRGPVRVIATAAVRCWSEERCKY